MTLNKLTSENISDIRDSHVKIGSQFRQYQTSHDRDFSHQQGLDEDMIKLQKRAQQDQRTRQRGHNFKFGSDFNDFHTTN